MHMDVDQIKCPLRRSDTKVGMFNNLASLSPSNGPHLRNNIAENVSSHFLTHWNKDTDKQKVYIHNFM